MFHLSWLSKAYASSICLVVNTASSISPSGGGFRKQQNHTKPLRQNRFRFIEIRRWESNLCPFSFFQPFSAWSRPFADPFFRPTRERRHRTCPRRSLSSVPRAAEGGGEGGRVLTCQR